MLSSLNILAAIAIATCTVSANAFPAPESFDLSSLNARAALPAVVGSASVLRRSDLAKLAARRAVEDGAFDTFMLSKRGEASGPQDCGDDEEWVEVWVEDDGSDDEAAPAQEAAPAPAPAVEEAQPEPQVEAAPASAPAAAPAKEEEKPEVAPVPLPSPVAVTIPGDLTTPENIAEGTYTVEEGCVRYQTVVAGDTCLELLEQNQDLGTTLDEFYCLNPAVDNLCYNLAIDQQYCLGYRGEDPLPVSSK